MKSTHNIQNSRVGAAGVAMVVYDQTTDSVGAPKNPDSNKPPESLKTK